MMRLVLAFWLLLGLLVPQAHAVYSVSDILGGVPDPTKASYRAKMDRVIETWLAVCPIERPTTYYFDSATGSDSNDGLSPASPKQTISAINSLAATNVAIKLKAGSVWRTTTQILIPGSISAYGSGPMPYISGFTQTIASGGSAWTNATGDRWTTTSITATGWIREQGPDWGKVYKRVTSTAEVESTPRSWFVTGGVLHINAGVGANPNSIAWEACPGTNVAEYNGVRLSAHGARADGLLVCGQGIDTGSDDQCWGIATTQSGDAVACMTNCSTYYHPRHNAGHNQGTLAGGRCLMLNHDFGWFREQTGIAVVAYSALGGQEFIAKNCTCRYGALPVSAARDWCLGQAFYAHRLGSGNTEAFHLLDCTLPANNLGPGSLWTCGNLAAPVDGPHDYVAVAHGCKIESAPNRAQLLCRSGEVNICCDYECAPLIPNGTSAIVAGTGSVAGYVIATRYVFDLTDYPTDQVYLALFNSNPQPNAGVVPNAESCHFILRGNGSTNIIFFNFAMYAQTANRPAHCSNSIWEAHNMGTGKADPGMGDDVGSSSTNNAMYGMWAGPGAPPSYQNWANTLVLTAPPYVDSNAPDFAYRGSTSAPVLAEVNLWGEPLEVPGESIGPYGRAKMLPVESSGPSLPEWNRLLNARRIGSAPDTETAYERLRNELLNRN